MGGPAWQFKKFADACSKLFELQAWKDKIAAGFTNSASVSGDKFSTIAYFRTLAMQMGQIWVGYRIVAGEQEDQYASRHQLVFRFWRSSCSFARRRFGRRSSAHWRSRDRQAIGQTRC